MSRVLPPTAFKPILKQPTDLLQDRSDVGCKTLLTIGPSTALLVNLFYSNVARQVECFLLPVLASDPVRVKTDCLTKEALGKHGSVQLFIAIVFKYMLLNFSKRYCS